MSSLYVSDLWLPCFSSMLMPSHIYLEYTDGHLGLNTFFKKKKNYTFLLSSLTFYDFDVFFYIFMFIVLVFIVVNRCFHKFCFFFLI